MKFFILLSIVYLGGIPFWVSAQGWRCFNDIEVRCYDAHCLAFDNDDFTPLSVDFDESGKLSVCAYSGCWQGRGHILSAQPYFVIFAEDLKWNNPYAENTENVLISLNRKSNIAILQVDFFNQPLICAPAP